LVLTARSVRITGILAALASRSTVSKPLSTTGEKAITSTFCAMNERMALIWFSCFCCASANFSSMPASLAAALIDSVLAVRHSLSAPIWLKPSTIFFCAKACSGQADANDSAAAEARAVRRRMFIFCLLRWIGTSSREAHAWM
jgi:hypothetical protein